MSTLSLVEMRVDQLERSQRRLRAWIVLIIGLICSAVLWGMLWQMDDHAAGFNMVPDRAVDTELAASR